MFKGRNRQSGFTLPEILVTVAIVAVLAAMVVPTVTSQLGKGDAPALSSSINSLRTSMTAFVTDVRKYPRRLSHLSTAITANDSTLFAGQTYGAAAAARWKGPYGSFNTVSGDSLSLGMNLKAGDSLRVSSNLIEIWLGGVTSNAEMLRIDTLIDNATGESAGSLRWTPSGSNATLMKYLLMSSQ